MIVSMNVGGSSYADIPSALGKGLKSKYISNRWNRHHKHSTKLKLSLYVLRLHVLTFEMSSSEITARCITM
jgi:hypothetical protein